MTACMLYFIYANNDQCQLESHFTKWQSGLVIARSFSELILERFPVALPVLKFFSGLMIRSRTSSRPFDEFRKSANRTSILERFDFPDKAQCVDNIKTMTGSRGSNGLFYEIDWRFPEESSRQTKQAIMVAVDRARFCARELCALDPSEATSAARLSIDQLVFGHGKALASSSSKTKQMHYVGSYFIQCQLENVVVDTDKTDESSREKQARLAYRICRRDDHKYSIKFLQPGIIQSEHNAFAVTEMILEVQILSTLARHAHISGIYGVTKAEMDSSSFVQHHHSKSWGFFYVTDWISETLSERMASWRQQKPAQQRKFLNQRLEMALNISSALVYFHSRNIVVYIRPDKIGFDSTGTLKVFGIGQARKAGSSIESCPSSIRLSDDMNILKYTAPEVFCGTYPATLASDVYGFAVLLWEIYSLRIAMDGYTRARHFEEIVRSLRPPVTFLTVDDRWDSVSLHNDANHFRWDPVIQDIIEMSCHPRSRPDIANVHDRLHEYLHQSSDSSSSYQDPQDPNDESELVKSAPPRSFSDEPLLELVEDDTEEDSEKPHNQETQVKELTEQPIDNEKCGKMSSKSTPEPEIKRVPPRRNSDCDDRSLWMVVAGQKQVTVNVESHDYSKVEVQAPLNDGDEQAEGNVAGEVPPVTSIERAKSEELLPVRIKSVMKTVESDKGVEDANRQQKENDQHLPCLTYPGKVSGKNTRETEPCSTTTIVPYCSAHSTRHEPRQGSDVDVNVLPRQSDAQCNRDAKKNKHIDISARTRVTSSSSKRTIQKNQSRALSDASSNDTNDITSKNKNSSLTENLLLKRGLSDPLLVFGTNPSISIANDIDGVGHGGGLNTGQRKRASRRCCSAPKVRTEQESISQENGHGNSTISSVKLSSQARRRTPSLEKRLTDEKLSDKSNEGCTQDRHNLKKSNVNGTENRRKMSISVQSKPSNTSCDVFDLKSGELKTRQLSASKLPTSALNVSQCDGEINVSGHSNITETGENDREGETQGPHWSHNLNSNEKFELQRKRQIRVSSSTTRAFHRSSSAPQIQFEETNHSNLSVEIDTNSDKKKTIAKEKRRRSHSFDVETKTKNSQQDLHDTDVSIQDPKKMLHGSDEKKIVDYVHPKGTGRRHTSAPSKCHHSKMSKPDVEKLPTDTPTTVLEESTSTMEVSRHSLSHSSVQASSSNIEGCLSLQTPQRVDGSSEQITIPSPDKSLLFLPHQSDSKNIHADDCSEDAIDWPRDRQQDLLHFQDRTMPVASPTKSYKCDSEDNAPVRVRKTASLSSILPKQENRQLERSRTMDSLSLKTQVSKCEIKSVGSKDVGSDCTHTILCTEVSNCTRNGLIESEAVVKPLHNQSTPTTFHMTVNKSNLERKNNREVSPSKNRPTNDCHSDLEIVVDAAADTTQSKKKRFENRSVDGAFPLKNRTNHRAHIELMKLDNPQVDPSPDNIVKVRGKKSEKDSTQLNNAEMVKHIQKEKDSPYKHNFKQTARAESSESPLKCSILPHRRKQSISDDELRPISIEASNLKESCSIKQSDGKFVHSFMSREPITPKIAERSIDDINVQCTTPSQGKQQNGDSLPQEQLEISFLPKPGDQHKTKSLCTYQLPPYVSPLKQRSPNKCSSRRTSPFKKSGDVVKSPRIRKVVSCQSALSRLDKGVTLFEQPADVYVIPSPLHTPVKTPQSKETRPDSCSSKNKIKIPKQLGGTKKTTPSPASGSKIKSKGTISKNSGYDASHSFGINDYSFVDLFKGQPTAEVSLSDLVMRMNPVPDKSAGESVTSTAVVTSSDSATPSSLDLFEPQPRTRLVNVDDVKGNKWLDGGEIKSDDPHPLIRTASKSSVIKRLQQSVDQAEHTEPNPSDASPRKQGMFGSLLRGGNPHSARNTPVQQYHHHQARQIHQHPRLSVVANVVATARLCDTSDHKQNKKMDNRKSPQKKICLRIREGNN